MIFDYSAVKQNKEWALSESIGLDPRMAETFCISQISAMTGNSGG